MQIVKAMYMGFYAILNITNFKNFFVLKNNLYFARIFMEICHNIGKSGGHVNIKNYKSVINRCIDNMYVYV